MLSRCSSPHHDDCAFSNSGREKDLRRTSGLDIAVKYKDNYFFFLYLYPCLPVICFYLYRSHSRITIPETSNHCKIQMNTALKFLILLEISVHKQLQSDKLDLTTLYISPWPRQCRIWVIASVFFRARKKKNDVEI